MDAPVKDLFLDRQYRHYLVTFPTSTECIIRADNTVVSADSIDESMTPLTTNDLDKEAKLIGTGHGTKRSRSERPSTLNTSSIIILDDEEEERGCKEEEEPTAMTRDPSEMSESGAGMEIDVVGAEPLRKVARREKNDLTMPIRNSLHSKGISLALASVSPNVQQQSKFDQEGKRGGGMDGEGFVSSKRVLITFSSFPWGILLFSLDLSAPSPTPIHSTQSNSSQTIAGSDWEHAIALD